MQPDQFIVAHVNDKQVRRKCRALARDGQNDMRVDAAHGRVQHLEAVARILPAQQDFQNAREAERRVRRAGRRRFSSTMMRKVPADLMNGNTSGMGAVAVSENNIARQTAGWS